MATDPREILDVAESLRQPGCGVAHFRSAISRAYYAAFLVADNFVKGMPLARIGREQHKILLNRLAASGDVGLQKLGAQLKTLQSRRLDADYHMDAEAVETPQKADESIRLARAIIHALDACNVGSPRWDAAKASIRAAEGGP